MAEKDLSKKFKKKWKENKKNFFQRLEPKSCCEGLPDCLIVNENKQVIFVELKNIKIFKNRKLPIRLSQKLWFMKYPVKAFLLFQIEKKYFLFSKSEIGILTKEKISWDLFCEIRCLKTIKLEEICVYLSNC